MTRARKVDILSVYLVLLLDLVSFGIVIPILPFMVEDLGVSATMLGVILTTFSITQALFSPLWGRLSDRIGRKTVLSYTTAGTAVSLVILALADKYITIFAARLLGGVFAANVSVATAYISDITDPKDRAKYMGLVGASFGIGFVLGPTIAGLLSVPTYRTPLFLAALLVTLNFIYILLLLPEVSKSISNNFDEKSKGKSFFNLNIHIQVLCVAFWFISLSYNQLETVFVYFMIDRFGWDIREISLLFAGLGMIMIIVQGGLISKLVYIFGEKKLVMLGLTVLIVGFALIPNILRISVLIPVLVTNSLGRAVIQPSLLTLLTKFSDESRTGEALGYFQSAASFARIIGPLIAGSAYDFSYRMPFYLASFFSFIGLMIIATKLYE